MDTTNVINLYEKLLDLETSNHNIFITVLLGMVILLLGATWWWNKSGAAKTIKNEISTQFDEEMIKHKKMIEKQISNSTKREMKEYRREILLLQADSARAMANISNIDGVYSHTVYWRARALKYAMDAEVVKGGSIRKIVDGIAKSLIKLKNNDTDDKKTPVYDYDFIVEIIETIPDILQKEKKQILNEMKGRKDVIDE